MNATQAERELLGGVIINSFQSMFFLSSITAVQNNRIIYPAVSYFIVFRETAACNNETLKAAVQTNDFDVRPIRSRPRGGEQNIDLILFAAVKDHNITAVKTMVVNSNAAAAAVHDRHITNSLETLWLGQGTIYIGLVSTASYKAW